MVDAGWVVVARDPAAVAARDEGSAGALGWVVEARDWVAVEAAISGVVAAMDPAARLVAMGGMAAGAAAKVALVGMVAAVEHCWGCSKCCH